MSLAPKSSKQSQFRWRQRGSTVTPSPLPEVIHPNDRGFLKCAFNKNQRTKYIKLFKLLLLTAVPTFIVIIQSIVNLNEDLEMYEAHQHVKKGIKSSIKISDIVHNTQIERGASALFISSGGTDPEVKRRLENFYKNTDNTIEASCVVAAVYETKDFITCTDFLEHMTRFRLTIYNLTSNQVIQFYNDLNQILLQTVTSFVRMEIQFHFWAELVAYVLLVKGKEQTGIERAIGTTYYGKGGYTADELLWYHERSVVGIRFLDEFVQFSEFARQYIASVTDKDLLGNITQMREEISGNAPMAPSVEAGTIWFDNMTTYINGLNDVQEALAKTIVRKADDDISSLEGRLIASALQLTITISMMPIVVILVSNIVNISAKLKERTSDLEEEKRQTEALLLELEDERKRTEELLYQLLPISVAKTLMENGSVDPESFDSVTILFSDVVGFTTIASFSTPMQVVKMLNKLYMTIDGHLERFDAYKVETIGDAYMVASGLPKRNGEKHVVEIAKLAIELLLEHMVVPHMNGEVIRLRTGINTGPCVAGVVGVKMPRYCIFGDTVNTASRMESTGLPGRIQMTESSAIRLQGTGKFEISERGHVDVKGKGLMRTFWLEGQTSNC